ncbi:MAG TPA: MraY family glycosyltransferase [Planctomycetota bacterium]|nr:MraY family glycosyltransferase [Planctomycetota bacterium]
MTALLGAAIFAAAYALARALLPRVERAARRAGYVDAPGGRKDHQTPTAYGGGLVVLAAVAAPALLGVLAAALDATQTAWPREIATYLPGVRAQAPRLLAILLGAALHLAIGYVDDRRGLSARLRFALEAAAALVLAVAGVRATAFLPWEAAQVLLTVVFVVFTVNATNFIDNMNGALAGVAAVQASCLLALAVGSGQWFLAALLLALLGGLFAFLPWNVPTARMFLGDAGSLLLGFLFAAIVVAFDFERGDVSPKPFVIPALLLAVPLADGVVAVAGRLRRGVHPFTAGHDHLAHRLVRRGLSKPAAAATLWGASCAAGLLALALSGTPPEAAVICVGPTALFLWRRVRSAL